MAKLSVIVCVYNTHKGYFQDCLQSIQTSTFKDIELIVVDDGSTIDYSDIISKFNLKYIKTENQGIVAARIKGVENATSPFVYFMDSDDIVSFNYLEALIAKIEADKSDFVLNDWVYYKSYCKYYLGSDHTINSDIELYGDGILEYYFANYDIDFSCHVVWNKMYTRALLTKVIEAMKKLNLPKIQYAEDVLFSYFIYKLANKFTNLHLGNYYYRIHNDQLINIDSEKKLILRAETFAKVIDYIEKDLYMTNTNPENKYNLLCWKKMLCYDSCVIAKEKKFFDAIPLIKELFKISDVSKSQLGIGKSSHKHIYLPNNITNIDEQLKFVYRNREIKKVYAKKNSYAYKQLLGLKNVLGKPIEIVDSIRDAQFIMPREIKPIVSKIFRSKLIIKLGAWLIPKKSKFRKYLRSRL